MSYQAVNQVQDIKSVVFQTALLFKCSFKLLLPIVVLLIVMGVAASPLYAEKMRDPTQLTTADLLGMVFYALIMTYFQIVILLRCYFESIGKSTTLTGLLAASLKKWLSYIGAYLLYMVAASLGLLLIVPGLIVMVSLILFPMAILVENKGSIAALQRSRELIKGHWWRTSTIIGMVSSVILMCYLLMATVISVGMISGAEMSLESILENIGYVSSFISPIFQVLFGAMIVVVFQDLSLRHASIDELIEE